MFKEKKASLCTQYFIFSLSLMFSVPVLGFCHIKLIWRFPSTWVVLFCKTSQVKPVFFFRKGGYNYSPLAWWPDTLTMRCDHTDLIREGLCVPENIISSTSCGLSSDNSQETVNEHAGWFWIFSRKTSTDTPKTVTVSRKPLDDFNAVYKTPPRLQIRAISTTETRLR